MAVCGTGHLRLRAGLPASARGFSRQPGHHVTFCHLIGGSPTGSVSSGARLSLGAHLPCGTGPVHLAGGPCLLRPPVACLTRARDCLPALHRLRCDQPRLRSRLTLGRLPLPRNPQASGVGGSHPHSRYSFRHSRFGSLQVSSRSPFSATPERSPTTPSGSHGALGIRGFGAGLEPRVIVGAGTLDQ